MSGVNMQTALSLHRKLAQVMYEADRIPKNGTAPAAMGGFKFVQVGDAADVIRKALAEKGVSMIPTAIELVDSTEHMTSSQKAMTTVTVRTTWTLTDGDSGESIEIQSMGAGADTGDKAIPKAQSNAMKYALLMGFLLSTGDDPELSDSSDRRPAERNIRADMEANNLDGGLIGTAEKTDKATGDYLVRESPEWGPFLGFRLKGEGRTGYLIEAHGDLATELYQREADVIGKRVQVWGEFAKRDLRNGGSYRAFVLERIRTPLFTIPASEGAPGEPPKGEAADVADSSGTTLTTTDPAPTVKDAPPDSPPNGDTGTGESGHALPDPKGVTEDQCDSASPYGDKLGCELLPGHKGPHKVLSVAFPETWTDR